MHRLFLDDTRKPSSELGFIVVRSYDEFVKHILMYGLPEVISFDHDLADEHYNDYLSDDNWFKPDSEIQLKYTEYKEKTGYQAAKWLLEFCDNSNLEVPQCYVHSSNVTGTTNIISLINSYQVHVEQKQQGTCVRATWKYVN